MNDVTIRWESISGHQNQLTYIVDEQIVGDNDAGFDEVIKILNKSEQTDRIVLKTSRISGLGGENFESSLPFRSRYDEFKKALGSKALVIDFI